MNKRQQARGMRLVPDYIEPFTAYRVWGWDNEGLKSLNDVVWEPGLAMTAGCTNSIHYDGEESPVRGCTCGIYAAKNWQHLINIDYARRGIHGEVALWGKIIDCDLGYRAQYQYPKFFIIPPRLLMAENMAVIQERMKSLIEFKVDIYIAAENEPKPKVEKIPLWIKDYGYSAQGIEFLVQRIEYWYKYSDQLTNAVPQVNDQISVLHRGLGVIDSVDAYHITISLWNRQLYRLKRKHIVWSNRNNRWETTPNVELCATGRPARRAANVS